MMATHVASSQGQSERTPLSRGQYIEGQELGTLSAVPCQGHAVPPSSQACRKWAQRRPFLHIASGAEAPLLPACPGCACWSHWLPYPAACRAARAAAKGALRPARPFAAACPTMGAAQSTAVANAGSWTACARCPSCEGLCPFACWQEQPCL